MAYEHKPGAGSLFKNNQKRSDSSPDYTGTINLGGKDHYLNAWLKDGKKGKFFSVQVKPKDGIKTPAADKKAATKQLDEDIPF
jgi:hypothetical protein